MNKTVEITGFESAVRKARSLPAEAGTKIGKAFHQWTIELADWIKGRKLSGQSLHRRTGTLYRSTVERMVSRYEMEIESTDYGVAHEYGSIIPAYVHHNLFGRGIVAHMPARKLLERRFGRDSVGEIMHLLRERIEHATERAFE